MEDDKIKTNVDINPKPASIEVLNISKEDYNRVKAEYLKDVAIQKKGIADKTIKEKTFNSFFKFSRRSVMNKSMKTPNEILVLLINLKKQIEGPILTKIYGGNFLVIRNHVYRFNPDRVFSFNKYKAIIAREFDRELVGIDDYGDLVRNDFMSKNPGARVNIDDPVLIKALIAAKLGEKPQIQGMGKWIIVGIIVIVVIIIFMFMSGGNAAPIPPTVVP